MDETAKRAAMVQLDDAVTSCVLTAQLLADRAKPFWRAAERVSTLGAALRILGESSDWWVSAVLRPATARAVYAGLHAGEAIDSIAARCAARRGRNG